MKHYRKLVFTLLALSATALTFTGCQTIEGAGEDIENAGDAISDAARGAS
ncbi:entericidin A/B family lipoprotein [Actomonas aquatica]|uniref:Entericidin A/B family lipoprotein n=1 Tax=Actomonas aquatica TaxID=2866162 RepID=A0ABZ1C4D4_9BACT|nr:entericidin A/B family lipoprotein [Opitutus sp. WL0086]WRQ86419.1 entericidin A/B family lipoprotein [Opitutus sp. WL0086]